MAEPPIGARLRTALAGRGWSYTRLIAEMRRVAARERVTLPTTQSLVVMLSRWCNDHERPSEFYQSILSRALGRPPARLGFVDSREPTRLSAPPTRFVEDGIAAWGQLLDDTGPNGAVLSTAELLSGASWRHTQQEPSAALMAGSGKVGAVLLDALDAMTESYRRLDRQLGAAGVIDDSIHHLQRIAGLRNASMTTEHRRRLAAAAGEVASLAAWQALDLGRPGAAWAYYCLATRAAREVGHRELHATSWLRRATCCCSADRSAKLSRWSSARAIWRKGRARGCGRGWPPLTRRHWPSPATRGTASAPLTRLMRHSSR
jgi:hypothetical protein